MRTLFALARGAAARLLASSARASATEAAVQAQVDAAQRAAGKECPEYLGEAATLYCFEGATP